MVCMFMAQKPKYEKEMRDTFDFEKNIKMTIVN